MKSERNKNVLALEAHLGAELHRRSTELTRAWLDRLIARLDVQPRRIFPTDALLNHIPDVLRAVSDYLCSDGELDHDELLRVEFGKLARLRREQGYDIDEILIEFEILGDILYDALRDEARKFGRKVPPDYAIEVAERLYRSLASITAITATTFREEGFRDRRDRARLLGGFGRDLAHELRNRLSTAEAALHLLGSESLEPATRERTLRTLRNTLQRIKGVADDVHSLAIAQGSEEGAQGRRLSLRPLLEEAVDELRGIADERQVRIEMREPIPDVQVDAIRVELAVINLVGNAVKYSDPKEEDRWVRISVQRDEEGFWRISVSDNGMGIPDEMQDRVFEQFVRAHPGVADGTGLGLAIARSAVEQMGGRIWLESEPGVGTTFHFTVVDPPAARED
ncbi:MAG TPA: sensor histidine kinase [Thermoanaerobaculia bacterium]|jgi:signal transduction histidine kinase|nr:sensor histidine kinase [Thermoanaerobaculia bacterium]